ncbi:MAG TPA: hypothetical protein VKI61_01530, partial [Chitinophagaceae bacterium]|nr:hypothetical protein [Chitinophagaceae bacterium]
MRKLWYAAAAGFFIFLFPPGHAQKISSTINNDGFKTLAMADIQAKYDEYKKIALQIWDYAELGYKEVKSTALLQKTLQDNGFTVDAGVAGMPTAFVATYGNGKPVIGILAEYDALPGFAQQAVPEKTTIEG